MAVTRQLQDTNKLHCTTTGLMQQQVSSFRFFQNIPDFLVSS